MNLIEDTIGKNEILDAVALKPLFLEDGDPVPFKQAVVKKSTGKPIAVVGNKYELIQTEAVINAFANCIDTSALDTNGLDIKVSQSPNAVRSIVKFTFPEHSIATGKDDNTHLQISLRKSHDGSWPTQIDVGGFRITCANGQVVGDFISAFRTLHTKRASFAGIKDGLGASIHMFEEAGSRWLEYKKTKINEEQGQDIVLDYLGKVYETEEDKWTALDRVSSRRDTMFEKFGGYSKEMGRNVLAAYNTLTDDATHGSEDAMVQFDRSKRAAKVIESHFELIAA